MTLRDIPPELVGKAGYVLVENRKRFVKWLAKPESV